jgi:hypothetical protein
VFTFCVLIIFVSVGKNRIFSSTYYMVLTSIASLGTSFYSSVMPTHVKQSGMLAPLRICGQQGAIDQGYNDIVDALAKATKAADQTFLVKPDKEMMPQALKNSRLLVVHSDPASIAVGHLKVAKTVLGQFANKLDDDPANHIVVARGIDAGPLNLFHRPRERRKEMLMSFL